MKLGKRYDVPMLCRNLRRNATHKDYLAYFYAEEFDDPDDTMGSHRSRGMVSHDKIRSYINEKLGADTTRANVAGKNQKTYSGFVRAASPHIMDLCGGIPPRFDVVGKYRNSGAKSTQRMR